MNELKTLNQTTSQMPLVTGPSPAPFSEVELAELSKVRSRRLLFRDGETLVSAGDLVSFCYILTQGWVGRVYTSLHGRQQIVNLYIPGDICVVRHGQIRPAALDAIALTDGAALELDPQAIAEVADRLPEIRNKFSWHAARAMNILSNQVVSLSLRNASKRVLYQLLEIRLRLEQVDALSHGGIDLPLTQAEIGQLCGLSVVAVNRAIRQLDADGLITRTGRHISFPDLRAAMAFAEFDPGYLAPFDAAA